MAEENNIAGKLYICIAESDWALQKFMGDIGDKKRIGVFCYPEAQKSPSEQIAVADALLDLTKKGYNQTVYTHSDHIVNRIVRRIGKDGLNADEAVKILFVTSEGVEEIKPSNISPIMNWSSGFQR